MRSHELCARARLQLTVGVSAGTLAAALAGAAAATPAPPPGQPAVVAVEEVIVTAQRREQNILAVPLSVQAISGRTLAQTAISNVRDLTMLSPSIAIAQSNSASAIAFSIRGVSSRSIGSAFVQPSSAIIIDGVPAARQAEATIDLDDVERIEVLRGPQGTLFGKSATAGVLQIINRRPQKHFQVEASASETTEREFLGHVMLNVGAGDTWLRFNAHYDSMPPLLENLNPTAPDFGSLRRYAFAGRLLHEFGDQVSWLVSANYSNATSSFGSPIPVKVGDPTSVNNQALIAAWGFTPHANANFTNVNTPAFDSLVLWGATSELTWRMNQQLTLTSLTGYREIHGDDDIDTDGGPCGANVGIGATRNLCPTTPTNPARNYVGFPANFNRRTNDTSYASQEFRFNYSDAHVEAVAGLFGQTLTASGFAGSPFVDGLGTTLTNYAPVEYRTTDRTGSVFGDVTWHVTPQVSVFGGLRYTIESLHIDYTRYNCTGRPVDLNSGVVNGGAPCPVAAPVVVGVVSTGSAQFGASKSVNNLGGRAGVQWQPTRNQLYYFSYARSYKGPVADTGTTAGTTLPFLLPETAIAFEIGAKARLLDNHVTLTLSAFTGTIQNLQVSVLIPGSATSSRFINAGDLRNKGFEFQGDLVLDEHWSFSAGVAYLDAKLKGGADGCLIGGNFADVPQQTAGVYPCNLPGPQQDLTGSPPQSSTPWRVTLAGNYARDLDFVPLRLAARLGYVWQDKVAGTINRDPRSILPSIGLLDGSISLTTRDGHWELLVFGRNLTDAYNPSFYTVSSGNTYAYLPKDYKRYVGVQLTARY